MTLPSVPSGTIPERSRLRGQSCALLLAAFGLSVCIALTARYFLSGRSPRQMLTRAQAAAARGNHAEAERIASGISDDVHCGGSALLIAGEAALRLRRYTDAVAWLNRIPDDGSPTAVEARCLTGDILLNGLERLTDAEHQLRQALAQNPRHIPSQQHLAWLLGLCGRTWEATAVRMRLLQLGAATPTDLLLLGLRDTARENGDVIIRIATDHPDDPLAQLGAAVVDHGGRQMQRAEQRLRNAIAAAPDLVEAYVRLCSLLMETGRTADFLEFSARLPAAAEAHPELWALRGDAALAQGDRQAAVRCYWESLRRDSCHQRACYQAAQLLHTLGETERSRFLTQRAVLLQEMLQVLKRQRSTLPETTARDAAAVCEAAGLLWEAAGWTRLALTRNPRLEWAQQAIERLNPQLTPDLPRTISAADPAISADFSDFPLPRLSGRERNPVLAVQNTARTTDLTVRFSDEAAATGIVFSYRNGADPATPGPRPFEFTGGGAAVLDFDGDGWPDVYLTQGTDWPVDAQTASRTDRLFRNVGTGRFQDITELAAVIEDRYSQGVTAGDYNGDGYPDLYVANLNANRLFHNNGDGTFSDVTAESGTGGGSWTTSCLMADLNGDALPDLYAVNYLAGDDVFARICRSRSGRPASCTPHDFQAAADDFFLNLGDGRFVEASDGSGLAVTGGRGLGIAAADFSGSGRLSVFVANDTDANFYFRNETPAAEAVPVFREDAVVSGLAFDRDGRTQACMGIAADDANADGLLDLFVTNYYEESNTLYLQQPGGLFRDAAAETGLRDPSLLMLGFGTQFLDGELDGKPDLITVNGHVDDLRDDRIPWRMRPQYFRNLGDGQFEETRGDCPGPWFEQEALGRGLAKLDWNRDGREDFVVTHLDAPAALLTNVTAGAGHHLSLQLRGVSCSRDAIGTSVRVTRGNIQTVRQLTAGDGYQASNQRQLVFGLGSDDRINELTVTWPSGIPQTFRDVAADTELILVQGRQTLVAVPR